MLNKGELVQSFCGQIKRCMTWAVGGIRQRGPGGIVAVM